MHSIDQQLNSSNATKQEGVTEPADRLSDQKQTFQSERRGQRPFRRSPRKRGTWLRRLRWVAVGVAITVVIGATGTLATVQDRYSDRTLSNIPLTTEAVEGHSWTGRDISFQQLKGDQFDVSFNLSQSESSGSESSGDEDFQLSLRDIDLTLLMPEVPVSARNSETLTRWFLTEREFNRQRVIFEPGSTHIDFGKGLPTELSGYGPKDLSVALTNNCLGAGYWELAVSMVGENGNSEKIYQGYFTFPRGAYAKIVSWLNNSDYWQQARTMEAWPGFHFLSGLPFSLETLRQVNAETAVPVTDLKTEAIAAVDEQVKKQDLIVYAEGTNAEEIRTWEDIRQADLKFQSFVPPGVYDESRLWNSDFSQLATVVGAMGRQITSTLPALSTATESLIEVEIDFENNARARRKLIVSGIDWQQVPKLQIANYSDGIYMPLGFGTPFTQDYAELEANPPAFNPFFSVLLDEANQVIDYRKDIGINGLVMHRDMIDDNLLHVYPMSYERITLIGHYVVDLDLYKI